MSGAQHFWSYLDRHLAAGRKVFLAVVAENTAHSPGTAGARMFLSEDGERVGTIGGGIMEHKLLQRAAEILKGDDFPPEIQTLHHRRAADGERSGMICAGSQTNLYLVCRPEEDLETVERLVSLLDAGRSGALRIDARGIEVVEEAPDLSRPQILLERDGEGWRYEEQLLNRRRMAILGGGHCALALARTMGRLGYDVSVFETRENVFEAELEAVARRVEVVDDFRHAGPRIDFPELTWVVVMTTDFPSDVRALAGAAGRPFRFLGVMGAPAKIAEIMARLEEEGFSSAELERIHAPVGMPIASHTPEEIAISVAAQILQLRGERAVRAAAGIWSSEGRSDPDDEIRALRSAWKGRAERLEDGGG